MYNLPRPLLGFIVIALALVLGALATVGVLFVWNVVLPPFRREDDDTLREFIPVASAYATFAVTTSLVAAMLWRRSSAPSRLGSRDIRDAE